jgi:hypothetical protein
VSELVKLCFVIEFGLVMNLCESCQTLGHGVEFVVCNFTEMYSRLYTNILFYPLMENARKANKSHEIWYKNLDPVYEDILDKETRGLDPGSHPPFAFETKNN